MTLKLKCQNIRAVKCRPAFSSTTGTSLGLWKLFSMGFFSGNKSRHEEDLMACSRPLTAATKGYSGDLLFLEVFEVV